MARVLLCGEVRGRILALHRLLHALQKKGPFDFVLCTGNFFRASEETSALPSSTNNSCADGRADSPEDDFVAATRTAFARDFSGVYTALQSCCNDLPLPVYIVDEAASSSIQRLQCRNEPQTPERTRRSSTTTDTLGLEDETSHGCFSESGRRSPTGNAGASSNNRHAEKKPDVTQPEANPKRDSCVSFASKCTCTPLKLMENVWILPGAGVVELQGLHVAFYAPPGAPPQPACKAEVPSDRQQLGDSEAEIFSERLAAGWGGFKAFRGRTDILLISRAPQGIFDGLPPGLRPALQPEGQQQQVQPKQEAMAEESLGAVLSDNKSGAHNSGFALSCCRDSSCLVDFLEPRHVIVGGLGIFWQRPHFRGRHFGYSVRLISLGIVGEKGPQLKAFHALQLRPISAMLHLLQQSDTDSQQQQSQQATQEAASREEAAQEARAALFFLPPDGSSFNPLVCSSRDPRMPLPSSPSGGNRDPTELLTESGRCIQGPRRAPKRQRDTGVVLVENLPYEVTDGEALQEAMKQFGQIKFVFVPRDKADPTRGIGKAYVVYMDPNCAAKAVEASGQLEGGGRPLRMRLHYDRIPFDRPTGAKRVKCGDVINTEPHADCWFCLANPQAEKHMIVDIGDLMYCAIPKGGLVPKHLLIIPIAHLPSLAYADESTRREASLTIEKIRNSFHKEGLDLVVYERYVPMKATRAMHCQIHAIPCRRSEALRAAEFFEKRARRAGLNMQKLRAAANLNILSEAATDPHLGYFYVEIPGVCTSQGQTIDRYLHVQTTGDSGKIPMNFGREVMAELLGEKEKVSWQACVVPRDEEELLAGALRKLIGDH